MSKPLCALLGSAPLLACTELEYVLGQQAESPNPQYCVFPEPPELDLPALQERVGGTVKFVTLEVQCRDNSTEAVTEAATEYLHGLNEPKVTFALGEWGRDHLPVVSIYPIKEKLQSYGVKVRFMEDSRAGLSTALLSHKKVDEIIILSWRDETWLGHTRTVTQPDVWSERDRGKPYADRKKGLLPPKVARMMTNIAIGQTPDPEQGKLYDPFCGSGTVLMEARTLGLSVLGSDLDPEAITGTRTNLEWQDAREGELPAVNLQVADVTHARWPNNTIRWIVTEPFLGKLKPDSAELANLFRGLHKLYWGAFRHWATVCKTETDIVIVLPAVQSGKNRFSLKELIDKVGTLGYTIVSGPWPYHRPDAVTEREIYHFRFTPGTQA